MSPVRVSNLSSASYIRLDVIFVAYLDVDDEVEGASDDGMDVELIERDQEEEI